MDHFRSAEQVKPEFGAKARRALIITTVVHESLAVLAHLVDVEEVAGVSGAIYDMGRFPDPAGDWHVVHAITQAGNSDTSVVATKAHWEFGKFDVQMFVGVAGSLKTDIPIGSVVAGEYVYNSQSGKVDDKGYYSRPHAHPAAPELIKAAQRLVLKGNWVDLIRDPKRTKLPASDVYPCPFPPNAIVKAIASGEQVVAGANTPAYQIIRKHLNDAGAVEMEGYGAMTAAHQEATSAIVIRGISDMCDGKDHESDAQYQPIASAHAAAFAFAMLSLRSKASPLSSSLDVLPTQEPERVEAAVAEQRVDYVVNFKGVLSDWSETQIEQVVEGLRKITGDSTLVLVRVDPGSVRVVVSVRQKDIPSLTLEAIKTVAVPHGEELLGAVTADDLTEAEVAKAALKRASIDLLSWTRTLPGGGWLERPEKQNIESRFSSNFSSTVLLGEPGSGKSALLAAIAEDLIKVNASIFAIKADLVSPEVRSEKDLQTEFRLPELPSTLIERLARLQPVFLFIDQLDALASQLDLQSERLNVLLNLVRRVGQLPNVHIVLSARTFEFNHDVRLKAIEAEPVTLTLPPWHEVKEKLISAGIDADTWPENAREVVRNPQALKTYLSLTQTDDDQPFSKYQSMLEQLWRQKIAMASDGESLAALAADIAGTMAEEETLWLASSRFDVRASALERLEALGLLVRSENGKSIAFSHQTVFDYVLARSFVRTAGRLSSYVLHRQNSLFVRAKLWSALHYLRDAEITSYEPEFLEIWQEKSLRRHLRLLLIEFLGELNEPVAFEKVLLDEAMQTADLRVAALKAIVGSPGWFKNFSQSAIPSAMVGGDLEVAQTVGILRGAWSFSIDDVARLLREKWLTMPAKDNFTWSVLEACTTWAESVEQIAKTILLRTPISLWNINYVASVIAVEQPEVAFRLIRAKLDYLLDRARANAVEGSFADGEHPDDRAARITTGESTAPLTGILEGLEWHNVSAMAEAEPEKFLDVLWPWFRTLFDELMRRTASDEVDHIFPGMYSANLTFEENASERLKRELPLLSSLALAVEGVASGNTAYFSNWAKANSNLEFMAPQRLIAHGFCASPEKYADQAFAWIFDDLRRLQLGNAYAYRQTSVALVGAVSPYWSNEQVREFEFKIQRYRPKRPAHLTGARELRRFVQSTRKIRAHLLTAVPIERLSDKSRELIAVEKRVQGSDLDDWGIRHGGASFIGSPMSTEAMTKAKDRDILKMFEEIPDSTQWDHPTTWMRGGNIQLSRAFAEFSKSDPVRALRIIEQFKPKMQERAVGYALESMAENGGHDEQLQEALLDLHDRDFQAEEFRCSAAHAMEKVANRSAPIKESVIQILIGWLSSPINGTESSEHEELTGQTEVGKDEQQADSNRQQSILWGHGGISILPSGNFPILSALTSILLKDKSDGRNRLLSVLNEHLTRERDPKIWQALLIQLSHAGGTEPEAVAGFLRALFARHPQLLETREAIYFLAYAQRWDDVLVHDLIAPWEHSENPMLRQGQGELVGLVSTVQGSERWIAMRERLIERGAAEAKTGLAYAGANLWTDVQFHAVAGKLLTRLIAGADKDRMAAILDVFRLCDDLLPEPTTLEFLQALTSPEANLLDTRSTFLVEKLQSLLPYGADIVSSIAMKLVESWHKDVRSGRTAAVIDAPQLTDLAITLHRLGGSSRETGVTVFEALIDLDAYGARETLAEIDGRFSRDQTSVRRRVSRRAGSRKRRSS